LDAIVKQLEAERDRLDSALQALRGIGHVSGRGGGRKGRTMSAAGRRRIAAAQRARWAKVRGQLKVVPIAHASKAGKRTMSAAARRRIAAAQRARWAKIRVGKK
jgi:hypothetical protein